MPELPEPEADLPALAEWQRVLGVGPLVARPVEGTAGGRVWWLGEPGAAPRWVVKRGARTREALLLHALARHGLPVPRPVALVRPPAGGEGGGGQAAHPGPILCTERVRGTRLAALLGEGAGIPGTTGVPTADLLLEAWTEALVRFAVSPWPRWAATGGAAADAGSSVPAARAARATASRRARERPRRWAATLPHPPVDAAPLLAAAAAEVERLGRAGERAPAVPVLCHGAWTPDNAVLAPEGPLVVLDWEHAHPGSVEEDAARVASALFALGWSARAALAAAEAAAGRASAAGLGVVPARLALWLVVHAADALVQAAATEGHAPRVRGAGRPPRGPLPARFPVPPRPPTPPAPTEWRAAPKASTGQAAGRLSPGSADPAACGAGGGPAEAPMPPLPAAAPPAEASAAAGSTPPRRIAVLGGVASAGSHAPPVGSARPAPTPPGAGGGRPRSQALLPPEAGAPAASVGPGTEAWATFLGLVLSAARRLA